MTSGELVADGTGLELTGMPGVRTALNPVPILMPSLSMFSGPRPPGWAKLKITRVTATTTTRTPPTTERATTRRRRAVLLLVQFAQFARALARTFAHLAPASRGAVWRSAGRQADWAVAHESSFSGGQAAQNYSSPSARANRAPREMLGSQAGRAPDGARRDGDPSGTLGGAATVQGGILAGGSRCPHSEGHFHSQRIVRHVPAGEGVSTAMASVTFDKATRLYPGSTRPAVDQIDLEVADGEFLVLVGPSGCGKSTTLRMLAGLEEVNEGRILIGDRDVTDVPPKDRDIAMVFQNYALYPHMTVAENMGFALKIAGVGKEDRAKRVLEAAKLLDLEPYLGRKPKALSGGQRQRVAMGRAIVRQPQVFLMDEPLSNLDAKLRVQTRTQIASLQRRLGVTTVYVTHDQTEALTMGDRIAVLKDGVLQQVGTPRDLYEKPNERVRRRLHRQPGHEPVPGRRRRRRRQVRHRRRQGRAATSSATPRARRSRSACAPKTSRSTPAGDGLQVDVDVVEELGADGYLYGHTEVDGQRVDIVVRIDGRSHPNAGEIVASPRSPSTCTPSTPRPASGSPSRSWEPRPAPDPHASQREGRGIPSWMPRPSPSAGLPATALLRAGSAGARAEVEPGDLGVVEQPAARAGERAPRRLRARRRCRGAPAPIGRSARPAGSCGRPAASAGCCRTPGAATCGSSPIDGSSSRMSAGSSISVRASSTCFCSPPEREPACAVRPSRDRSGRTRPPLVHPLAPGAGVAQQVAAHQQVVPHGHRREEAALLRHVHDPQLAAAAAGQPADVLVAEERPVPSRCAAGR